MFGHKSVAVVGSGIAGLGAAWLLSQRHRVTVFEKDVRPGGHSHTVDVATSNGTVPVDTGFIVYNTASYPNLIALFDHLRVPTAPTSMSFAVSLDGGRYEYAGSGLSTLFGQPSNLANPGHWRMIRDTLRFFREAPELVAREPADQPTLGQYLVRNGYSDAFVRRHILPMAAAIWSTPSASILDFPAASFIRFFANHGLLQIADRPAWRTVAGGSREYVRRLVAAIDGEVRIGCGVRRIVRQPNGVAVTTSDGEEVFDACVIAAHADDALSLLADPTPAESRLLGAFRYSRNHAVLHADAQFMPRRKRLWSSWNYASDARGNDASLSVTYWMNRLQPLGADAPDLFVTLNPPVASPPTHEIAATTYTHPIFDSRAMASQQELWQLQGRRRTWFCGSYFGYGFHEDGLQSGLAAAEDIGGVRRPWTVPDESGRIHLAPRKSAATAPRREAAE